MIAVHSPDSLLHDPARELYNGQLIKPFESPARAERVLQTLGATPGFELRAPERFGLEPLQRVHTRNYIQYLQTAWEQWSALGRDFDLIPFAFPRIGLRDEEPAHIDGKAGFFSFDTGAPITGQTWTSVKASVDCALTAQKVVSKGARSAFALCRPPGHHAGADLCGGYCYVNNAAVAAQAFRDDGAQRVAILDVDYHHGNGTQNIFYSRADVLFASLHADPALEFPYFLGRADETGEGEGKGFNLNLPLPLGTDFTGYRSALAQALGRIAQFAPQALVVSLGVDTFERDPICRFKLTRANYAAMGRMLSELGLPTLFVFEGGYALDELGNNVSSLLQAFG